MVMMKIECDDVDVDMVCSLVSNLLNCHAMRCHAMLSGDPNRDTMARLVSLFAIYYLLFANCLIYQSRGRR